MSCFKRNKREYYLDWREIMMQDYNFNYLSKFLDGLDFGEYYTSNISYDFRSHRHHYTLIDKFTHF
jgi:hypothetical protein